MNTNRIIPPWRAILSYIADIEGINDPPKFNSEEAACFDIQLAENVLIMPHRPFIMKTGLHLSIPKGYEVQIRMRSGMAKNHGLFILNSPATIDSDYTGEIMIIVGLLGVDGLKLEKGTRVAQGQLVKLVTPNNPDYTIFEKLTDINNFRATKRGDSGFGSTGTN